MDKLGGELGDMLIQIALRIPPSDPARLVYLALACKKFLRLLTQPDFRTSYASKHGGPPFVGYFLSRPIQDPDVDRFVATAPPYKILSPNLVAAKDSDCWFILDVRQSRVLLFLTSPDLVVWVPATGAHYLVPRPKRWFQYQAGAVICAESPHCKHPNCATIHDFRVVFVGCEDEVDLDELRELDEDVYNSVLNSEDGVQFVTGCHTWTSTYSIQTNSWTEFCELEDKRYFEHPLVELNPPVLVGNALYFTLETHQLEGEDVRAALKFDMTSQKLSVVMAPEDARLDSGIFLSTAEGFGFAGFAEDEDDGDGEAGEQHILSIWVLKSENQPEDEEYKDEDPEWKLATTINLKATLPPNAFPPGRSPSVIGFMSGEPVIFIQAGDHVFTVGIDTMQTEEIGPSYEDNILPFKHFYMPEGQVEGGGDVSFEEAQEEEEEEEEVPSKKRKLTHGVSGTTCATVLTKAIFTEVCKSVVAGVNAMDLRRGISMAVDAVVTNLKGMARMISTSEEIAQVGTISDNGEREIGELIAKAMEKVGKEGVITIADGNTLYNELEVVEGMKLDRGYISPYFVTNQKNQICELNEPFILIHDKKISNTRAMVRVMQLALKKKKPLLIVAEDLESEALGMILNKLTAGVKVCAVKAPGFGDTKKANLQDLAILTGAEVITEELGMNLESFEPQMFGTCKKVTISKNDSVILDGAGDKKAIEERAEQLRSSIEQSSSDFDKEKLKERLAKLSGGIAVLKIGGASEAEVGEMKDRVTDALNATKAAVEEGIVPGGGAALLYASKDLVKLQTANSDQKIGVQIIQNALKTPLQTIASNAGVEGSVIVGKLLEQENTDLGYDAAKGEYVDMVKAGIIDPLKVIRTALMDAASVSPLVTTTESIIIEIPKEESSAPATEY